MMDNENDLGEVHDQPESSLSVSSRNVETDCEISIAPECVQHNDQITIKLLTSSVRDIEYSEQMHNGETSHQTCVMSPSQLGVNSDTEPLSHTEREQVAPTLDPEKDARWLEDSVKIRQNVVNILEYVSTQLIPNRLANEPQYVQLDESTGDFDGEIVERDDVVMESNESNVVDSLESGVSGGEFEPDRASPSQVLPAQNCGSPGYGEGHEVMSDENYASQSQLEISCPLDMAVKGEPMEEGEVQDIVVENVEEYIIPGMLGDNMFISSELNMLPCVSQEEVVAENSDGESQTPMLISGTFNNFKDAEVTVEVNEEEMEVLRANSPVDKHQDSSGGHYPSQPLQETMFHAMAPLPRNLNNSSTMPYNNHTNSNGQHAKGIKRVFPFDQQTTGPVRTKAARKITPPSPAKDPPPTPLASRSLQENLRRQELDETFFTCDFCFKLFRRRNALMAHIKLHEALNIGNHSGHVYECGECKKTYSSRYNLNHHLKRCHGERVAKCPPTHRSYKCNRCGKTFQKRKTFAAHVRVHPQFVHECVTCFQKFSWESELALHNKTHEVAPVEPTPPEIKEQTDSDQDVKQYNKLKLDYCYSFITRVKNEFAGQPQAYQLFLSTIKQFKFKSIDLGQFLEQIALLFKDHQSLIDGFNIFLPHECRVEVPIEIKNELDDRSPQLDQKFNPQGELNDSLAYLSQVKERFNDEPHIYTTFTYIIKEYKLNSLQIPEVAARVTTLFKDHPDLILGFNTFLPPHNKIMLPQYHSQHTHTPCDRLVKTELSVENHQLGPHSKPKKSVGPGHAKNLKTTREPTASLDPAPRRHTSNTARRDSGEERRVGVGAGAGSGGECVEEVVVEECPSETQVVYQTDDSQASGSGFANGWPGASEIVAGDGRGADLAAEPHPVTPSKNVGFDVCKQVTDTSGNKILIISANLSPRLCETASSDEVHVSGSDHPAVATGVSDTSAPLPYSPVPDTTPLHASSFDLAEKPVSSIASGASPTRAVATGGGNIPDLQSNVLSSSVASDRPPLPSADVPVNAMKSPLKNSLLYKQLMSKSSVKRFSNQCNIQSVATFTKIDAPPEVPGGSEVQTGGSERDTNVGQVSSGPSPPGTGSKLSVPYVVNSANNNVIFSYANSIAEGNGDKLEAPEEVTIPAQNFVPTSIVNGSAVDSSGRAIYTVANTMITVNPTKIAVLGNSAMKIAPSTNSFTGVNIVKSNSANVTPCTYTLANTGGIASLPTALPTGNPGPRPMILIRTNPATGSYLLANPGARLALTGKKVLSDYVVPANKVSSEVSATCESGEVTNSRPNDLTKNVGVWKNKINRTKRPIGPKMTTMKTYISNKTINICKPSVLESVPTVVTTKPGARGVLGTVSTAPLNGIGNGMCVAENVGMVPSTVKSPKQRKIYPKVRTLSTATNVCVTTQGLAAKNGMQKTRLLLPAGTVGRRLVIPVARDVAADTGGPGGGVPEAPGVAEPGAVQQVARRPANRAVKTKAARKQCLDLKPEAAEVSLLLEEPGAVDTKTLPRCEPKTYSRKDSLAKHVSNSHSGNSQPS